ncbi:MAG: patatin-like phospholipase family protein [Longimicrobiales bacterium]
MSTTTSDDQAARACEPVEYPGPFAEEDGGPLEDAMALCMSGGGYRAMLFHLGTLWRLNELGVMQRLKRIASVSGGSITAAHLGLRWSKLQWQNGVAQNFVDEIVEPIRDVAGETIDKGSILGGALLPGVSVSDNVIRAYRKHLFGDATLQDLADDTAGAPRFVINATNVQTGALLRFSRPYLADWRIGKMVHPDVQVAVAVAASSAFPPVLSPVELELPEGAIQPTPGADLHREPFTTRLLLTDGGVYDNLGLETVWKRYATVLVSDGGGQMEPQAKPHTDWARHGLRINGLIDNQVRSLRKRQVVGSFQQRVRKGSYWRMRGNILKYAAPGTLPCPLDRTMALAQTPTRLAEMDKKLQERIINWGYALADAAIRAFVEPGSHQPPTGFPYPASAV